MLATLGGDGSAVLISTVMFASLTSLGVSGVTVGSASGASTWTRYLLAVQAPWRVLQLRPICDGTQHPERRPCAAPEPGPLAEAALPAPGPYARQQLRLTDLGHGLGGTLGGFKNIDLMDSVHVSAGPELSWLTPDSPREDLLRVRVVAPGWGVRYTWDKADVSVGITACTRFVMFGEDFPVVDMLTSEARIELRLP